MLSGTNKKVKTTDTSYSGSTGNGDEDFDKVKQYLLNCPLVPSNHPAIQAAVTAIEKELQRMERDRKLQRKFAQAQSVQLAMGEPTVSASSALEEDGVVVVERRPMSSSSASSSPTPLSQPNTGTHSDNNDVDEMEWQDVQEKEKDAWDDPSISGSFLGKNLAKLTIDVIAQQNIKLQFPLAAIAVALHASLRSDLLGFSCTGVPEDLSKPTGGFAPPVRELPKTQFLPPAWDVHPQRLALRYRKAGTGAMILTVELADGNDEGPTVTVRWQPAINKNEPSSQTLLFQLEDHINLDSWNAALKTSASVSPALHYKSLALLLSNFCQTFDLGAIHEGMVEQPIQTSIPTTAATTTTTTTTTATLPAIQKSDLVPPASRPTAEVPPVGMGQKPNVKYEVPTTLDQAFPGLYRPPGPHGDFAGDLLPSGLLVDPRGLMGDGRMGGNLMGPNHPLFQGDDRLRIPMGGPGSMQPRFDPIYPDGIDYFPNPPPPPPGHLPIPGRPSNRPSRTGEPNPDHLPPPNSLGDNMFL